MFEKKSYLFDQAFQILRNLTIGVIIIKKPINSLQWKSTDWFAYDYSTVDYRIKATCKHCYKGVLFIGLNMYVCV